MGIQQVVIPSEEQRRDNHIGHKKTVWRTYNIMVDKNAK